MAASPSICPSLASMRAFALGTGRLVQARIRRRAARTGSFLLEVAFHDHAVAFEVPSGRYWRRRRGFGRSLLPLQTLARKGRPERRVQRRNRQVNIFYIIGVVVVVLIILGFLGLR
ncbi:MAG TPA: hypothetical protein VFG43_11960 [Geminicoccaceae bacterium]|nr:hypothetical protein [Geminicoccaceae bacterium]